MTVSRWQIIVRGVTLRCPNCGARTLFAGLLKPAQRCAVCGMLFDQGSDAFFLGAASINYTVTLVLLLVPVLVLVFRGSLDVLPAILFAVGWCIIFPIIFYRPSRSLWLMIWFLMFPGELPANQRPIRQA